MVFNTQWYFILGTINLPFLSVKLWPALLYKASIHKDFNALELLLSALPSINLDNFEIHYIIYWWPSKKSDQPNFPNNKDVLWHKLFFP